MPRRSLGISLALILGTVALGLAVRFASLGLPPSITKYGGSTLWAMMVYWIVSTLFPSVGVSTAAVVASFVSTAIEFLKLYHATGLDAFRLTLPGILLLGRFFSIWDIVAYSIAIATGALIDRLIRAQHYSPGSNAPNVSPTSR